MSGDIWMGGASKAALAEPALTPHTNAVVEIAGVSVSMTAQVTILLLLAGVVTWAALSDLLRMWSSLSLMKVASGSVLL